MRVKKSSSSATVNGFNGHSIHVFKKYLLDKLFHFNDINNVISNEEFLICQIIVLQQKNYANVQKSYNYLLG